MNFAALGPRGDAMCMPLVLAIRRPSFIRSGCVADDGWRGSVRSVRSPSCGRLHGNPITTGFFRPSSVVRSPSVVRPQCANNVDFTGFLERPSVRSVRLYRKARSALAHAADGRKKGEGADTFVAGPLGRWEAAGARLVCRMAVGGPLPHSSTPRAFCRAARGSQCAA